MIMFILALRWDCAQLWSSCMYVSCCSLSCSVSCANIRPAQNSPVSERHPGMCHSHVGIFWVSLQLLDMTSERGATFSLSVHRPLCLVNVICASLCAWSLILLHSKISIFIFSNHFDQVNVMHSLFLYSCCVFWFLLGWFCEEIRFYGGWYSNAEHIWCLCHIDVLQVILLASNPKCSCYEWFARNAMSLSHFKRNLDSSSRSFPNLHEMEHFILCNFQEQLDANFI